MKNKITRLLPAMLAAVTFASATASAQDGLRDELFKTRWNQEAVKQPHLLQQPEDCGARAPEMMVACIQGEIETYRNDPDSLSDCEKGLFWCALDVCTFRILVAQSTCGSIGKDSQIADALTRW